MSRNRVSNKFVKQTNYFNHENNKHNRTQDIGMVVIPDIDYDNDDEEIDNDNELDDCDNYDVDADYDIGADDGLEIVSDRPITPIIVNNSKSTDLIVKNAKLTLRDARKVAKQLGVVESNGTKNNFLYYNSGFEPEDDPHIDFMSLCERRECWAIECHKIKCQIHSKDNITENQSDANKRNQYFQRNTNFKNIRIKVENFLDNFNFISIWSRNLKQIEGFYGPAIVSYFYFLRWLLFVNVLISVCIVLIIIIPQNTFSMANAPNSANHSNIENATQKYKYLDDFESKDSFGSVIDFLQGSGWMFSTLTYVGVYDSKYVRIPILELKYNTTIAYLICTLIYFALCFALMLKYSTSGVRDALLTEHHQQYSSMILCGWDYCTHNQKRFKLKQSSIALELRSCQEADQREEIALSRNSLEKAKLIVIRIIINAIVLILLIASFCAIGFVTSKSIDTEATNNDRFVLIVLIVEYSPILVIFILYLILPELFNWLIKYEKYISRVTVINITLIRVVLLRISSLIVLLISLFYKVSKFNQDIECWENYVGQSFYKLMIGDLVLETLEILIGDTVRKLLVRHNVLNLKQFIDYQQFDIPKNVLSLVYIQMLCWLGTFYCPILPMICILRLFLLFYLQKYTLFKNCVPPEQAFRASRTNSIFISILILVYFISFIPIAYTIGSSQRIPSRICSPFASYDYKWQAIENSLEEWPSYVQTIINDIITSNAFTLLITLILCLLTYYYYIRGLMHKKMIDAINSQLKDVARDRLYLMNQFSLIHGKQNTLNEQSFRNNDEITEDNTSLC